MHLHAGKFHSVMHFWKKQELSSLVQSASMVSTTTDDIDEGSTESKVW